MAGEYPPEAKGPTLEGVNAHLLGRLDSLLTDATAEDVLLIANAVAKLNSSSRNNDLVSVRINEEQRQKEEDEINFGHLAEGESV